MSDGNQGKFGLLAGMLSMSLDDIPDLPSYKAPPPGVYKLIIKEIAEKDINGKTALEVKYVVSDIIELSEADTPEEDKVAPGGEFSEAFWFNDPEKITMTLSVLKSKFGGLAEACGTVDLLEILTKAEGMQVQAIVTNRTDKNDKTKVYASTRDMVPAV